MVQIKTAAGGASISRNEGIAAAGILLFIVIAGYVVISRLFSSIGSGVVDTLKSAGEAVADIGKTKTEIAMEDYEIGTTGAGMGTVITGVAPSPSLIATMERYYGTGDVKTYVSPAGTVIAIDAPSIDPSPISTEKPSHRLQKGNVRYLLYGCDITGHNCTSSKKVGFFDRLWMSELDWLAIPEAQP